jgi:hypothetical protein
MFKHGLVLSLLLLFFGVDAINAQVDYQLKKYSLGVAARPNPSKISKDWMFEIQNVEDPFQGNSTYRGYLEEVKKKMEAKYSNKSFVSTYQSKLPYYTVDTPIVTYAMEGNKYSASVPNDNTMAISNDGIVVAAINTNIIFYDTKTDSLLKTISLAAFSDTLSNISTHQYDPKAIYDYQNDRFILVFLAGASTDATSNIIVAFSSTNNPMDEWYLYALAGNPLLDDSWSDFPAIAMSENELFITINLLKKGGGSWQTLFKQSVIWQMSKTEGYQGDSITPGLISDINFNQNPIRNIHPVVGGSAFYGPELYFLSQRNFDIQNDTFFLLKTTDVISSPNHQLEIQALTSDQAYGMPPNAMQTNNKRLATNDSRVLGAFYQNNHIQFVGNTVDTLTGHASFYHGLLFPDHLSEKIHLNILTDTLLEFGYPNISYCGTNARSMHSMISFNYTSLKTYPGFAAMFFEGNDLYSKPIFLKKGNSPIYILVGTQRWGDYSASQPRYNKPGEVWVVGTFGKLINSTRAYGTWITAINSQVTDIPVLADSQPILSSLYPNPTINQKLSIDFVVEQDKLITISIFDNTGKHLSDLYHAWAKQGRSILSFSTLNLASGLYFLSVSEDSKVLKVHKFSVL